MKKGTRLMNKSENDKIGELMSSIQSKLELLARDDDSEGNMTVSQPLSLQYDMLSPKKQSNLNMEDFSRNSNSQSPILSRINQIEERYFSKLTVLNQRVTILQNENSQFRSENEKLRQLLLEEQQKIKLIQQEQGRILDQQIEEMKQNVLGRLKAQIEQQVQGYIRQLGEMRDEIGKERRLKLKLEKQLQLMTLQRNNFQEMYRDMMQKFKKLMQTDVNSYQRLNDSKNHIHESRQEMQSIFYKPNHTTVSGPKKSEKTKRKKTVQLPKDKLIPFLTKGIQQLKQKLKLN